MDVRGLSDVFVASGVNDVDAKTFTALFYGYEVRGKIKAPAIPMVEFFFYGNVYFDDKQKAKEFVDEYEEKFGHTKFRFSDKYISVLIDMSGLDAPKVKERLAAVGNFMISNGFGAIALQPEEPEPEPEPAPVQQAKPQPKMQQNQHMQQQRQVQQQPQRQVQQPVYEEPKVPFEDYRVLDKLTEIFILGVNKVTQNTFTTIYHGYNVVGKMLSPVKDDIEIVFYGELTENVTDDFVALQKELDEKYGKFPIRMVGGSCDAILYLDGKDVAQCKEMLGQITGFMIKHSIVAVNLPNTIGNPVATYTQGSLKAAREAAPNSRRGSAYAQPVAQSSYSSPSPTGNSGSSSNTRPDDGNSFAKNFLKKFR